MNPNYRKFAPYLLTAFFFIFVNNIMGLIPFFPGGANVTGNIAITMVLAICTFLAVNIFGTKHYWKDIFWPDVPTRPPPNRNRRNSLRHLSMRDVWHCIACLPAFANRALSLPGASVYSDYPASTCPHPPAPPTQKGSKQPLL